MPKDKFPRGSVKGTKVSVKRNGKVASKGKRGLGEKVAKTATSAIERKKQKMQELGLI